MSKVADVKLGWVPSVSSDVVKQVVSVVIDGAAPTEIEVGPEVQSIMTQVNALSSVVFTVLTTDSEGMETVSEQYTFTLGNLEAPQPATGLFHEVVAIRDVEPEPTPEPPVDGQPTPEPAPAPEPTPEPQPEPQPQPEVPADGEVQP